jgi:hypothetical protein
VTSANGEETSSDLEDAAQHGASSAMASATTHDIVTSACASACMEALLPAMLADRLVLHRAWGGYAYIAYNLYVVVWGW